ncbi:Dbl homology domain-containing protein [Fennellomyces sp. T-0311]|nr:Dbl homology domain-containing protein [Fennellomyces sp. T-0311]
MKKRIIRLIMPFEQCQNVDVIFPTGQNEHSAMYMKFMDMLGDRCPEQDANSLGSVNAKSDSEYLAELDEITYEKNDEQRYYEVEQFIDTEANYVNMLKVMVELVVSKLNPDTFKSRNEPPIINRFAFKNIFLNIEEILKVNECFMSDLRKCNTGAADDKCFGEVCASHMGNFACYRNYSLGFESGRLLHANEVKSNSQYRKFLESSLADPKFNRFKMLDILIGPAQRLTRYILMIKGNHNGVDPSLPPSHPANTNKSANPFAIITLDILKHTPPRHRDYEPLKRAYVKACSIASMEDDDATKLATMCHNIFQSFKNSSLALSNLIRQNRSFIAHLDAIEVHRTKGYQKRPVTFFLFTDKLLIAERPNYQCRGIDLLDSKNRDKSRMRTLKKDQMLRFKGWIDIEQAQIFEGAPDIPNSFLLFASTLQKHGRGPAPTTESQEDFFRKGFRLFTVPPREDVESDDCLARTVDFVTKFQHGQALAKRYDPKDEAYHRQWCDLNVYSNVYDTDSYTHANYKNNIAVVYLEEDKSVNIRSLFPGVTPWIVALVQGTSGGFRFSTWSKVELPLKKDILDSIPLDSATEDGKNFFFQSVFWNNGKRKTIFSFE